MRIYDGLEIDKIPVLEEFKFSRMAYSVRSTPQGIPLQFSLQIHITDFCNLRCVHCYDANRSEVHMSYELFEKIIDEFMIFLRSHKYIGQILITGGEPILHPELFKMLDYLYAYYERGYLFKVVFETNGTLVNDVFMKRAQAYSSMLHEVQISVDGCQSVHDQIRGKGAFIATVNALKKFVEAGFKTALSFVVSKMNKEDAVSVLKLAEELAVGRVTISRMIPIGSNELCSTSQCLSKQEFHDLWKQLNDYAHKMVERIIQGEAKTFLCRQRCDLWHLADIDTAVKQWLVPGSPRYLLAGIQCQAGSSILAVLPDGTVYPCRRFPKKIGDFHSDTMKSLLFENDVQKNMRMRKFNMTGKCKNCDFYTDKALKPLCSGGAPCLAVAYGKTINDPDPLCWIHDD